MTLLDLSRSALEHPDAAVWSAWYDLEQDKLATFARVSFRIPFAQ